MRELSGDTRIHVLTYPDFEEVILTEDALIEDAKKYEIGDISTKTGLQKCLVNGRIVWLLPHQGQGFSNTKLSKGDLKTLAKSAKIASADGQLNAPTVKDAEKYMQFMMSSWKQNPVKSPLFNNARIRLDRMSYNHLFKTKGKQRAPKEFIERAECLPYVRDILERSGKPAEHLIYNGSESYSVIGKANINGADKGIKIIISRHTDGRYFYLSVFSLKKI